MDYGTLANVVIGLGGGAIGALGWLFKLHGDVRVLKADLAGEIELRKALFCETLGAVALDKSDGVVMVGIMGEGMVALGDALKAAGKPSLARVK